MNVRDKLTTVVSWFNEVTGEDTYSLVRTWCVATFELAPRPGFRWEGGTLFANDGDDHVTMPVHVAEDRFFEDAGATWVPGWPPLDGEEVQALVVAYNLGEREGAVPTWRVFGTQIDTQINPRGNESYSDAAWRKLRGY